MNRQNIDSPSESTNLISCLQSLCQYNDELTHSLWASILPNAWDTLGTSEIPEFAKLTVILLAKASHNSQAHKTLNVIQTFIDGFLGCTLFSLPPYLLSHLGRTFNCWHSSIRYLENLSDAVYLNDSIRNLSGDDNIQNALCELYNDLQETDYAIGLWRRRCMFSETNVALSFQQIGSYQQAQSIYEIVQNKARSGVIPFSENEYSLWESEWVTVTRKLQEWDLLSDISKNISDSALLIDSAWRVTDWSVERDSIEHTLKTTWDPSMPDFKFYEAYLTLLNFSSEKADKSMGTCLISTINLRIDFSRLSEEAAQMAIKTWRSLPKYVSVSHIPLLSSFQKLCELYDASVIQMNLLTTNASNIDSKSIELKTILMSWFVRTLFPYHFQGEIDCLTYMMIYLFGMI